MTFATIINAILSGLCVIVVVQSLRMVKSVREIRNLSLDESIAQIDAATSRAQAVLTELKMILSSTTAVQNRAIVEGEALRDELELMIGIGNSVADRITEAATAPIGPKAVNDDLPDLPKPEKGKQAHQDRRNASASNRRNNGQRKPAVEGREKVIKAVKSNHVGHA